ncbi:MAG: restriction endonuclease subunit S [Flavihumibacter sp.]|nr:restriction endonuclease subunit S [Flavihumibacter sp.]
MNQNIELPKDWKWVTFEDVAEGKNAIVDGPFGSNLKTSDYIDDTVNGVPVLTTKNLEGDYSDKKVRFISKEKFEELKRSQVNPGDILVAKIGSIGKTGIYPKNGRIAIIPANLLKFTVSKQVAFNYVYFYINSRDLQNRIKEISTATAQPAFNVTKFRKLLIPLPPKPTQQAIVSKIEELFSELDKGIEQLKTAQQQLKTYRQAVLKWAFEGKLSASGFSRLKNEQDVAKKQILQSPNPVNPDSDNGELPDGWKLTKLGGYIEDISSGKSYRCDERPPNKDEIGIVKVSAVTWGFFDEMESKTCFLKDSFNEKYLIRKGDFLFSRANTIELIGACVLVNTITKTLMLSDKILRFTFSKGVSKEYVLYYLRSRKGRKQIEMLSTGNQDSMRNIGQEKIRQIEFPYCPIEEQNKIVQEIESRLSVADKMEESITQSMQQAEALRQSILKKAFEGRLVP